MLEAFQAGVIIWTTRGHFAVQGSACPSVPKVRAKTADVEVAENSLQDVDEEHAKHEYGACEVVVVCEKYSEGKMNDEM